MNGGKMMNNSSLGTMHSFQTKSMSQNKTQVDQDFESLQLIIAEVQKAYKIKGFILKNSVRAIFNIYNTDDVFELALLSSELFDSSAKLFEVTKAGTLNHVVLKGSQMSVLCLSDGENQLSIFMDKGTDYNVILDKIVRKNF
jgi:hypothetical protein